MHYVMSDIHGQYEMYKKMLDKIQLTDSDQLYIIGDAVDRGPESIRLLIDIMSRGNVTFLIGNHEHMMYKAVADNDWNAMSDWMYNGGETTIEQFEQLDKKTQSQVLEWLASCPLVIPNISVNSRNYYLAHACHTLYDEKELLLYKDAGEQNIEQVVWSREYRRPNRIFQGYKFKWLYGKNPKTTLIIGHTPVQKCSYGIVKNTGHGRISRSCSGHLINIDCGCAMGRTLGCLRLEDGKEYYVDAVRKERDR